MTTDASAAAQLPPAVMQLLDGHRLEEKVGVTMLVAAADRDLWVRVAMLSVGECRATSPRDLRLVLHAGTGTTAALSETGRGLLHVVVDGVVVRAWFSCRRLAGSTTSLAAFAGVVERVAVDRVPYARVRHGIEFELEDAAPALERWSRQLRWMTELPG